MLMKYIHSIWLALKQLALRGYSSLMTQKVKMRYYILFLHHLISPSLSFSQDSSPWVEKEIMFASLGPRSPTSTSDDEDDEDNGKRQREYPTESSDDDDSLSERRERLVIIEEKPVNKSDDGKF